MNILANTPWWVFLIFAYLLYVGFNATRTREVWIPKLFIIPAILILYKANSLLLAENHARISYLLFSMLGYYLGMRQVKNEHFKILKPDMSVELKGSWSTLFLLMGFFLVKYVFGFMNSERPELAKEYMVLELGICAIFSWYFLGRAIGYWMEYKKDHK